jgi:replicative DNA helicase
VSGAIPPNVVELEWRLIASVLEAPGSYPQVPPALDRRHFLDAEAGLFWAGIQRCVEAGDEITPYDVLDAIRSSMSPDHWERASVGASKTMLRLRSMATAPVERDAARILAKAARRAMIRAAARIVADGESTDIDDAAYLEQAQGAVVSAAREIETSTTETCETIGAIIKTHFAEVNDMAKAGSLTGIKSGLPSLDALTLGWREGKLIIVGARPGMGKAQPYDAPVLTPSGWRVMGDLAVGDMVIGASGQPRKILRISEQGEKDVFRVAMSDGASAECCADHLWLTRSRKDRRSGGLGCVKTTSEIADTIQRSDSGGLNHSIPYMVPAAFQQTEPLPLSPYLLGLYLGDGDSSTSVRITNCEPDIRARIAASLPPGDAAVDADSTGRCLRIKRGPGSTGERAAMADALRALGLVGLGSAEKFIPEAYLMASVEDRIELLRGLCDTDGYVTDSRMSVEYCTASERLAQDVLFLVGSLGGVASHAVRPSSYVKGGERHECLPSHRMVLSFPRADFVPVSSAKHLARWKGGAHRLPERFIASVDPVGRKPCRCIAIDGDDKLYVTSGFIVTHNSALMGTFAIEAATDQTRTDDVASLVMSAEMSRTEVAIRALSSEAQIDGRRIVEGKIYPSDWENLGAMSAWLTTLPIWVDDKPQPTLAYIRQRIRRINHDLAQKKRVVETAVDGKIVREERKARLQVVVVDYLQILGARDKKMSREQQITELADGLKALAKEERCTIIALAQLNRDVEKRPDKRPMLSDLRESGGIEQAADAILMLYRDEYYNKQSEAAGLCEINVAKMRGGKTGRTIVRFDAPFTRFSDLAPEELDDAKGKCGFAPNE